MPPWKRPNIRAVISAISSTPSPQRHDIRGRTQIEVAHAAGQQVSDGEVKKPHSTLTVEEDSPSPGGLANGLWKGRPITPLTKCGTALARKAPPKK